MVAAAGETPAAARVAEEDTKPEQIAAMPQTPEVPPTSPSVTEAVATLPDVPPPTAVPPATAVLPTPEPPSPPQLVAPPAPVKTSPPPREPINWEQFVGVRGAAWAGAVLGVLGGVYFLKVAADAGFLGPPVRLAMGLTAGAGLLVGCELWGRRYPFLANALNALGIAFLFSTFFAANTLWHLMPALPIHGDHGELATFACLALVTFMAVMLSLRHDSIFIALLGLVGGFASPILLSTGQDAPIGLFTYLLMLNVGLALVAYRKRWSLLTAASLAFTALYQWGWVVKFVTTTPRDLSIAAAVFFIFPVFTAVANLLGKPKSSGEPSPPQPFGLPDLFDQTALVASLLPLLFALCLAWVPALGARPELLFGFLFLVDAGLAVLAAARGPGLMHAAAGLATLLVFAGWISRGYSEDNWPSVLGFVSLFVVFYLLAPQVARWRRRPFDSLAARGSLTAPLLFFMFPALAALEPRTESPALLFGTLLALAAASGAVAVLEENGPLHFLAAFFAVAAEAVWSAKHLTPERLPAGLALYALFGLFYLGVPVLARRLGKRLLPAGSGAALLFCSLAMLLFLAAGDVAHTALWGMGLLLALLNLGLFFKRAPAGCPSSPWPA